MSQMAEDLRPQILKPSSSATALQNESYIDKPFGYSYFPNELIPAPKSWAAATGNLVFFREHQTVRRKTVLNILDWTDCDRADTLRRWNGLRT